MERARTRRRFGRPAKLLDHAAFFPPSKTERRGKINQKERERKESTEPIKERRNLFAEKRLTLILQAENTDFDKKEERRHEGAQKIARIGNAPAMKDDAAGIEEIEPPKDGKKEHRRR